MAKIEGMALNVVLALAKKEIMDYCEDKLDAINASYDDDYWLDRYDVDLSV